MSLREYNRLKKTYKRQHGTLPPKGTKLPQLRKLMGQSSTSSSSSSSSSSAVPSKGSANDSFWNNNYGKGRWR
jgi:hypothetical protein